jgi:hypothetical protein
MKKTFLEKINDKKDLNESVSMDEDEENDDILNLKREMKVIGSRIITKSTMKKQVTFDLISVENNIKLTETNIKSNPSDESVVSLEVDRINSVFMKKFNTKITEKNLDRSEIFKKGDEMFLDKSNLFNIIEDPLEEALSPKNRHVFSLPKRQNKKKIFQEFLCIGIEKTGLEYINDHDELYLPQKFYLTILTNCMKMN